MSTPYPNVSGDVEEQRTRDNYNFYHSQLRIRVECAFGMLVQRWGLLRTAMPRNISIQRIIAMVNALCKLHNFCINESHISEQLPEPLATDHNNILTHEDGYVELQPDGGSGNFVVPIDLMHGGHHFEGIPNRIVQANNMSYPENELPRTKLHDFIAAGHWERPRGRNSRQS